MTEARAVGDERSAAGAGNALNVPAGYKRTEAGVIPDDWGVSTVAAEFSVQLGKMLDAAKNTGASKPYIGNRSVQWGRIDLADIDTVPMTSADLRRFRLRSGDLLVCEGGEIGRAAIWEEPIRECYFQKALHRLRPLRCYDSYLMMSFLQLWASTGYLTNYVTQTSIAHLPKDKLETVPLPVPTAAEQRAIAAVLSDVEELIGSLEALIAKKRAIKQAAMQELLTGRTRLPGFGGEWKVKRLEEVANVTMGQSPLSASYNVVGDGLPLIQGNADIVRRTTIDRIWTTLPSKRCGAGDIVLTVRAPVGSVARASKRSCLGRGVCGLKPLGHGPFLYYALILRESQWDDVEQGSTFAAANSAQVAGFPIAVPMDLPEQQAIATILSDMDAEIAALERHLDKTRAIKQGMMHQLLTGSIRLPIPVDDDAHDA